MCDQNVFYGLWKIDHKTYFQLILLLKNDMPNFFVSLFCYVFISILFFHSTHNIHNLL